MPEKIQGFFIVVAVSIVCLIICSGISSILAPKPQTPDEIRLERYKEQQELDYATRKRVKFWSDWDRAAKDQEFKEKMMRDEYEHHNR
jgi:hypothetical protein